jgi:outer membrane protein TolC
MPLPAQFPVAAQTVEAPGEPQIPADWWKLYGDAQLDALVAEVRSRNADLRIAAAQVEEAEAVMRQARAAVFPEVNLSFTRTRSRRRRWPARRSSATTRAWWPRPPTSSTSGAGCAAPATPRRRSCSARSSAAKWSP